MKAWKVTPDTAQLNLEQQQMNLLGPAEGEVQVRMQAASLNKRDLMVANGTYPGIKEGGLIPLSDGAGEVIAIGAGVDEFSPGDRVVNLFWRDLMDGNSTSDSVAMGGAIDGVLAEEVILPAHALIKIPDSLSYNEAATLPCAGLTAWNALMETGGLKPGQTVLTLGTGGVSLFVLQFAKAAGATVIITSSSDEKLARAKELGADVTINYRATPDWADEVLRITENQGVDIVVDTGGPGTLNQSLQAAAINGQVFMIGVQAGIHENISPLPILFKKLRLQGIMVGNKRMFENMLSQMLKKEIKPVIDQVFSFDNAPEAFTTMESANHFGKIVIAAQAGAGS